MEESPNILYDKSIDIDDTLIYVLDDMIVNLGIVIELDLEGFAVSAGSACSSGKVKESHVLKARGLDWASKNSIRISSGWQNSENDLEKLAQAYIELYKRSYK